MRKKNSSVERSKAVEVSAKSAAVTTPALEAQPSPPSSLLNNLRAYLGLHTMWIPITLALAASLITLTNEFACDDAQQVINNPLIKSLANLPAAFTSGVWQFAPFEVAAITQSYYRPLFNVWLMISNLIFGGSIWGWHLMTVLLHAGAAAMVYAVIRELFDRRHLALIAASLFAVLPVHAEAVAWVTGGIEVLMTLLVLAAYYCYLRYRKTGRIYHLPLALVFYLLALWSNEAALGFPLVVAYMEVAHFGKSSSFKVSRIGAALIAAGLVLMTVVYGWMRYRANGAIFAADEARLPLASALLTVPLAIAKYLGLLIWPFGYSYQHYINPIEALSSARFLAPLALVIALIFIVVRYGARELKFAAAWLLLTLAPVLLAMNRFELEHLIQERYLYLPSLGFCLAAALGVEWLAARQSFKWSPEKFTAALVAAVVVLYSIAYIMQCRHWRDSLTVYRHAVAVAPNSAAAHSALASELAFAGRAKDAEAEALRALELDPQYDDGYLKLSFLAQQQGNFNKALEMLEQAKSTIRPTPINRCDLATITLNLSLLYSQKKDYANALDNAQQSLALWPRAAGWYYSALLHSDLHRFDDALRLYQEAMRRLPPAYAVIHLALGIVYERLERLEEARSEYLNYLALAPPGAPEIKGAQQLLKKINDRLNVPDQKKLR